LLVCKEVSILLLFLWLRLWLRLRWSWLWYWLCVIIWSDWCYYKRDSIILDRLCIVINNNSSIIIFSSSSICIIGRWLWLWSRLGLWSRLWLRSTLGLWSRLGLWLLFSRCVIIDRSSIIIGSICSCCTIIHYRSSSIISLRSSITRYIKLARSTTKSWTITTLTGTQYTLRLTLTVILVCCTYSKYIKFYLVSCPYTHITWIINIETKPFYYWRVCTCLLLHRLATCRIPEYCHHRHATV